MKCPNCGFTPPRGRPQLVNDRAVRALRDRHKWSLAVIAELLGVSRGAIQGSLARTAPKEKGRRSANYDGL